MEINQILAVNLKHLRQEKNMTMGQLSKVSGISKAMLSDMEKGNSNPTINTIMKVATGLGVSYTRLMEPVEKDAALVTYDEAEPTVNDNQHFQVFCYYGTSPTRDFEIFRSELDPYSEHHSDGHREKSQEYLYLLQGVLELHTESDVYTLQPGDALMFEADQKHSYHNTGDERAVFIDINYYPA